MMPRWFPLVTVSGWPGVGVPYLMRHSCSLWLGTGLNLYVIERTNPGFIYQVEAFDPEDTSQNIPLNVSTLSCCCACQLWGRSLTAKPVMWVAGSAPGCPATSKVQPGLHVCDSL